MDGGEKVYGFHKELTVKVGRRETIKHYIKREQRNFLTSGC